MKLAVFGSPIAHSRSPEIHQAFAAQTGREIQYERILASPEEFSERFAQFAAAAGVGANVTAVSYTHLRAHEQSKHKR